MKVLVKSSRVNEVKPMAICLPKCPIKSVRCHYPTVAGQMPQKAPGRKLPTED
ncbi:hypothetical protein JRC49_09550 [Clostridiales bacterium FE2011]|nr:hypothetical protein JRC49_09550 [Clostridiales bacterium FE2011]QTE73984.1 hypothetical protein JS518_13990 [Clostridiales bacterium FE2010]